jgi:hypothetical protein
MNDLKFAIRQLVKNPGFTAVAVLSLARASARTAPSSASLMPFGWGRFRILSPTS